ncbi:hypothetical protein IFM89_038093 [Coptis chinensis]|uniref:Pectin acetylesterase n=1 Tax=Coptis chinensis TaxID=261450 RepID=A0A835LKT7_9MAGN|nr:hypothetical protein IFM89_038093 [Coptis chinensis]
MEWVSSNQVIPVITTGNNVLFSDLSLGKKLCLGFCYVQVFFFDFFVMKFVLLEFVVVLFVFVVLSKWVNGFEDLSVNDISELEGYGFSSTNPPLMVPLTLIQGADAKGAVCLDGSLPGYHWHRGYGSGANSWLVNLEGGGWCNNIRTCVFRIKSRRGSSARMEKEIPFTGILSNKSEENPGFSLNFTLILSDTNFFNWNRVKLRYCDGASFTGDSEDKAAKLQFRGQRIYLAGMEELMAKGMRHADQALLSGCSAGGLATILHCDEFRGLFPSTTKVKCLSDAGLFLDASDISGGRTLRDMFGGVVSLQVLSLVFCNAFGNVNSVHALDNFVASGSQKNLPLTCTNHLDPTSCFFPQNLIANIKTPLFLLNAAYDSWQVRVSLAPTSADPRGSWTECRNNISSCSASQIKFLQDFRNQMLNATKDFSVPEQNGLFINSCYTHCQSENPDTWFSDNSPHIHNKDNVVMQGIAQSVGD